jgi:small-conductance mechanosensitive channel
MAELQAAINSLDWPAIGDTVLKLAGVVVATIVALAFAGVTVRAALSRLFQREVEEGTAQDVGAFELQRRRDTLEGLLNRSLRVIILVIGFLMVLQVLQLDIGPAIAGLGIIGLAIGLGSQSLVRDYVAGAFVLIENQYAKGDVVTIAGITGSVEDISLRRTALRDADGTVHYVPHGLIGTSSNLTRGWAAINLDLPVPYGTPLGQLTELIDGVGDELNRDEAWKRRILGQPAVLRVEGLTEQGMRIKIVGRATPGDQWAVTGELRRRIIDACAEAGLAIGWR